MRFILFAVALVASLSAFPQHAVPPDIDIPPVPEITDPLLSARPVRPVEKVQEWEYKTVHSDKELNEAAADGWELVAMSSDQQGHNSYAMKRNRAGIPPVLLQRQEPRYTEWAFKKRIQGEVLLSLTITKAGIARDVGVIKPLDPGLDQSAVEAVKQWRFRPGTREGQPIDSAAQVRVNFHIVPGQTPEFWFFYLYHR